METRQVKSALKAMPIKTDRRDVASSRAAESNWRKVSTDAHARADKAIADRKAAREAADALETHQSEGGICRPGCTFSR